MVHLKFIYLFTFLLYFDVQVLVNQNKSVLDQKDGAGDTKSYAVDKSLLEFGNLPTYSKKTATRNIKALTSCSSELLIALTDLFLYSPPEKRLYLKVLHSSLV